jgi:hypothetical protein
MSQLSQATGKKSLYISSNKYAAVTAWQAGHAYSVGDVCRPTGISLGMTMTQANPGVFTWRDNGGTALTHNFQANDILQFTNNSDALPTNLAFATNFFVQSPSGSTFNLAATWGGANINTTAGSNTGTHKATCLNERYGLCYVCIVAGTSAASLEPVWPSHLDTGGTRGNTVTDGGVTWMEATGCAILNGDVTGTPTWAEGGAAGDQVYGQVITNNAQTYVFICTTNNAAPAGVEPTWNTTTGVATTDGSASWTCLGSVASWQARKWVSPFKRVVDATQGGWGDGTNNGTLKFYIGDSHHGIYSSANYSWNSGGTRNLPARFTCVSEAGSCPPVSGDVTTGAIEENIGSGYYYPGSGNNVKVYGVEFLLSNTAFGYPFQTGGGYYGYFEQCKFFHMGTSTIVPGTLCEWKNCQVKFGSAGGGVYSVNGAILYWHNDDPTIPGVAAGGTAASHLFGGSYIKTTVVGVDLATNVSGDMVTFYNNSSLADVTLRNCKVPSVIAAIAQVSYGPEQRFRAINCDNGAFFNHSETWDFMGGMVTDRVGYAAGGAVIQGSAYSWKLTTQYATDMSPWCSLPISTYNSNITSTVTATVYGCTTGALPTNDECWLEADFLGSTSSPLSTGISGKCALLATPTNLTTDTTDWSGAGAARQNTHAYILGDELKIASSGGNRLFVCTTAGTSAGSLPGGYATAVDGDNITDGGAHFTAVVRFKMTLSLTTHPLVTGPINAVIRVQNAAVVKSYWFDPVLNLS